MLYANADQDAAEAAAAGRVGARPGAGVLVLDPVDGAAAVTIVAQAKAQGVPVIAYDRLIAGADLAYYVSFDNEQVGELQATALVDELEADGSPGGGILMVNGSPTDNNAAHFQDGAHEVLDESGCTCSPTTTRPTGAPTRRRSG